jgi:hypothetical protein
MSEDERVMSMAVNPAASAAKKPDMSEMLHAGVGCPWKVTQLNSRAKT